MIFLAIVMPMSIILGALAVLHLYWAAGGLWPGRTPRQLIDTVIGDPRRTRMPPAWITASVGLALAGAAALPFVIAPIFWMWLNYQFGAIFVAMKAGLGVGLLFIARGIVGYLPFWRRLHPAQPFAKLDARLYSPLCLLLGVAFIFLDFVVVLAIATI